MQYTCWPITKTFTSANTTRHLAHTEPMIEKWRLDSDGFMSPFLPPFFSLSLPQRVIQSTLHLFLMNWASMFGVPHPHRLLSRFPKPSPFQSARSGPHDLAALLSQRDIPGVSALSLIISPTLPSPSFSPTVRQTDPPHTCLCMQTWHKLTDTYMALVSGRRKCMWFSSISYTNRRPGKAVVPTLICQLWQHANMQ